VKTRNVRKYWETAYDMIIIRSIKDLSRWDILMSEAYEKFLEFKKLYQLYEDPPIPVKRGMILQQSKKSVKLEWIWLLQKLKTCK
jgi:hypothetical protein